MPERPIADLGGSGQATGHAGDSLGRQHPVPLRPRWLRVHGLRISYVDVGTGPVVLLLHGLGHSIHAWRKNIGPLTAAGYRVMAIDLPGFGWSDRPSDYRLEMYTTILGEWLDLHCVDRAVVVGNSMGGLISAAFAAAAPERVAAAVLADPAGFAREQSVMLRLASLGPARLLIPRSIGPRRIRTALRWVYHDTSRIEPEEVARIAELAPAAREALVAIARRATSLRGMRPALGLGDLPVRIDVPTLILWGEHDRLVPVSHAQGVRALIPDSELTVFPDCGHSPMMEVPEQFNTRVIRFLRERLPEDAATTATG